MMRVKPTHITSHSRNRANIPSKTSIKIPSSIKYNFAQPKTSFARCFSTQVTSSSNITVDNESLYSPYKKLFLEEKIANIDKHLENDNVDEAEKELLLIYRAGYNTASSSYTKVIYKLSQNGLLDRARYLFDKAVENGVDLTVGMFNALIRGYLLRGYNDAAKEIITILFKNQVPPNSRTFDLLIFQSLQLNRVTLALQLMRYIVIYGNKPNEEIYNRMIGALFRNSLNVFAHDFECFKNNIKDDVVLTPIPDRCSAEYPDSKDHIQAIIDIKTMMKENSRVYQDLSIAEASTKLDSEDYFSMKYILGEESFRLSKQNSSITKYFFDVDGEEVAGEPLIIADAMTGDFTLTKSAPIPYKHGDLLSDYLFYNVPLKDLKNFDEDE